MDNFYLFAISVQDTRLLTGDEIGNVIYTIEKNEDLAKKKALFVSYGEYQKKFIRVIKTEKIAIVENELSIYSSNVEELIKKHKAKIA